MKKTFKTLLKVVSIVVVLFIIVSILVATLVDINQYKNEISKFVKDETGLRLEIQGDMALSIFSGIKFNAKQIKLFQDKSLIADIDSLHLGVDAHSLYNREPEISSLELQIKSLHLSRNKNGQFNFLPLLNNRFKVNHSENDPLALKQLSLRNIQLSIAQLHFLDEREDQSITLDTIEATLTLLPIIDNHELVIDDPRILVGYSYSGELTLKKALSNQYQIANLSLRFTDRMGDFFAEQVAFSLIREGKAHALPPLMFDAHGKLQFTLAYRTPNGASEPLWTQPYLIKLGKFDFNLPNLKLVTKEYQLETNTAHIVSEEVVFFKVGQSTLDDLLIKSLIFDTDQVDLNWKSEGKYHFKKPRLQLSNLPVISTEKPLELMSDVFLNKFAQKGKVRFSSASVSHKGQSFNKGQGFKNIEIHLEGKNKSINLSTLTFNAMESEIKGEGLLTLTKKSPQWSFKLHSNKLNLRPVAEILDFPGKIEGYALIDSNLSGVLENYDFKTHTGRVHVQAKNLILGGMDLDRVLKDFQSSQNVGLLDVGAVTLLGPAGILVSKGNDYRELSKSFASKGNSKITQLNSDIAIKKGIATMNDVAFATEKYRLAVKGKINTVENTFSQFEVATIDEHGCPIYKEEVTGTLDSPTVKQSNLLVSGVVNPLKSLVSRVRKPLKMNCKQAFYNGVVKSR